MECDRAAPGYHVLMKFRALAILGAVGMLACASAPPAKPLSMPTSGEGSVGGEMIFLPQGTIGTGATFDDARVMGPTVNMAATPEGVWGGDVRGRNFVLQVSEGRLTGAAFEVAVEQEGDALHLAGIVDGRRVNVRLSPRRLQGTTNGGVCSFDLTLIAPGSYRGFLACPALPARFILPRVSAAGQRLPTVTSTTFRLSGDAAQLDRPVLPQLALALLAVLPP